ncbi:VOC family protein [Streptomyces sp. NBC_00859]|uniref:VOC family protein n=1 Tax=Streptomyces sp. NBC_00859 TaxID=2903682 RepID=UPI00386A1848|nr:VOC family protein [Streptomyces sp. NBC_00859]
MNHTIVAARDNRESAEFLATVLGLRAGAEWGPFVPVELSNGVTLDFASVPPGAPLPLQHYAFLVPEEAFDGIFARMRATGTDYYADPHKKQPGEINHHHGGRGVYFMDPSGHAMEVITQPYGNAG